VLSELYYPEEAATGHYVTKIAEGLADRHRVGVLCGQPSYEARGLRAPRRERRRGVDIYRCGATVLNKDIALYRALNLFTITVSIFLQACLRIRRGDSVLVVTNPPTLPFLAQVACRIRGARCLLLVHDLYPDVLVAAGLANPGSFLTRGMERLQRRLYRSVDRVIVLGRDMRARVAEKLGGDDRHLEIIPNFADTHEIVPSPRQDNALIGALGLGDKFVVQYSGNIGRMHGIEDLLACARLLESTDTVFLFIGSGAKLPLVERAARERDPSNLVVLGRRPRNELSESLGACDIAVISLLPGMGGVSVPSRMYNILAAGRPILAVADANSELALVVREERVGWVVPPGQPLAVAEAIEGARSDPYELERMSARARRAAEGKYLLRHVNAAYDDLIRGLDGGARR